MRRIRIKPVLFKSLKAAHPDVYGVLKDYCDEHGYSMGDVLGSATAAFLSTDDKTKDELIKKMSARKLPGGTAGIDAAINMFTKVCNAMGSMFDAMNKAKAGMTVSSMVNDFTALTTAMNKMKQAGAEAGKGTIEDTVASAFVRGIVERFTGGKPPRQKPAHKPKGKVTEIKE